MRPMGENTEAARNRASNRFKNIAMAAACGLYLVYPSAGLFELIPDFIPVIGNLDEVAATTGLLYALSNLGWIPWTQTNRSDLDA